VTTVPTPQATFYGRLVLQLETTWFRGSKPGGAPELDIVDSPLNSCSLGNGRAALGSPLFRPSSARAGLDVPAICRQVPSNVANWLNARLRLGPSSGTHSTVVVLPCEWCCRGRLVLVGAFGTTFSCPGQLPGYAAMRAAGQEALTAGRARGSIPILRQWRLVRSRFEFLLFTNGPVLCSYGGSWCPSPASAGAGLRQVGGADSGRICPELAAAYGPSRPDGKSLSQAVMGRAPCRPSVA